MRTNYVLIDLENICPKQIDLLGKHEYNFSVKVFVGHNQTSYPIKVSAGHALTYHFPQ